MIGIAPQVQVKAIANVTTRRNGTLMIGNLRLRILDEYDDGVKYVGGLLHTEFVAISGDGFKDLVITGTIANTGEKETDPVTYTPVTSIYIFQPAKKNFSCVFHIGPQLDESP
jgi:hypothetical protein